MSTVSFSGALTMDADHDQGATLSLRKRLLFTGILSFISFFSFLFILEVGLRLADFGKDSRFYRVEEDAQGKEWIRENRDFTAPYFSKALVRRPQPFRIPREKGDHTYRIFLLGSSAAMGDPESSFSLARCLEKSLEAAYPDIHFEVINAAITAINSHIVRTIANDCSQLNPDLYIVYEGHNEVIGPFGPTAVLAPFIRSNRALRLLMYLKATRTGQLIDRIASLLQMNSDQMENWGGMQMFLDTTIEDGDERLDYVSTHFKKNLHCIVESAAEVGADTILSTVLVNQKDFAPFQSAHGKSLSRGALESLSRNIDRARSLYKEHNYNEARVLYEKTLRLDPGYAQSHYELAEVFEALGDIENAQKHYREALDLDTLRFRTDTRLNQVIKDVAASSDAVLLDLEGFAEAQMDDGMIGDKWLYEHVHLTFWGAYHCSVALFDDVSRSLLEKGLIYEIGKPLPLKEISNRLAYTLYEQALIIDALHERIQSPPFTQQSDYAERLKLWTLRKQTAGYMIANLSDLNSLFETYEYAMSHSPKDWILARNYGMALLAFGKAQESLAVLQQAYGVIDDDPDLLFALATAYKRLGMPDEAKRIFDQLTVLEPLYPGL